MDNSLVNLRVIKKEDPDPVRKVVPNLDMAVRHFKYELFALICLPII